MKAPWQLWAVGILSLLWNAGGAIDYVMTQIGVESYVANMPDGMRAHLQAYPAWMTAIWALAVWTPLLAAAALLARRAVAVPLFGLSLVFVLLAGLWNYALSVPKLSDIAGPGVFWFWIVICVLAALQLFYASAMSRSRVLR